MMHVAGDICSCAFLQTCIRNLLQLVQTTVTVIIDRAARVIRAACSYILSNN